MTTNINKLVSSWINDSNGVTGGSSMYSLRVDGNVLLNSDVDMKASTNFSNLPNFTGTTPVVPLSNQFITRDYADNTYAGGGITGTNVCYLNRTNYFNYPTADIIRSNTSSSNNFYISGANSEIGSNRVGAGVTFHWKITQPGQAYFRSPINSFKYWAINESSGGASVIRYYNLGGNDSVVISGDGGSINLSGTLTSNNANVNGITGNTGFFNNMTVSNTLTSNNANVNGLTGNTGYINSLTVSSSINLPNNSINDNALSSNIVKKNTSNTFISGATGTENLIQVNKTIGSNPNGFYYIDNYSAVGYYDLTSNSHKWNIDSNGNITGETLGITGQASFFMYPNYTGSTAINPSSSNFITKQYADATYHNAGNTGVYVDLSSNQTITGQKDFTTNITKFTSGLTGSTGYFNNLTSVNSSSGNANITTQLSMNDKPIILRTQTDFNHVIKYVNYETSAIGGRVDGQWIQGYDGGVLASALGATGNLIYLQWKGDNIYTKKPINAIAGLTGSTGYLNSLTVSSSVNLPNNSINDNALSSNIVKKNTSNIFISTSPTVENLIQVNKTIGTYTNAFWYIDNYCAMGLWNITANAHVWNIDSNGNFTTIGGIMDVGSNGNFIQGCNINDLEIFNSMTLTTGATWVNASGSYFDNIGTMTNNAYNQISSTSSIPASYSGSKIYINVTGGSPITVTLPVISGNEGTYFWITGDDTYTTTIQVAGGSGNDIYDGTSYTSSIILYSNQVIFMFVTIVAGIERWVYQQFSAGSNLIGLNNVWTGTNAYNTSLPTSTLTPTTSTQLITKGYGDSNYVTITGDQNITTGIKRFYKAPMLGSETATGLHTKIGYQCGTYYTDATKRAVIIGNNALASNPTGINLVDYAVVIGPYAMQNYGGTTAQDQFTCIGAFALRSFISGIGQTCIGTYALQNLQYGSNNVGIGNASGGGMIGSSAQPCNQNFIMGSQSASGNGRKVLTEAFYAGATQTSATIVTPFMTNMRAGFQLYFYSSATPPTNNSQIELITSYDHSTYTAVIANSRTIITGSYLGLFSTGTLLATATYPGSTSTGTSFTIPAWNSTAIASGNRFVYYETASLQKWAVVSSWNNTTKVLVVTTTITIFTGTVAEVYDVAQTAQNRGLGISNNTTLGYFALANCATECSRNLAIGTSALNGVGNEGSYDNRTFITGSDNIGIGYGAGAFACIRNSSRNIWIGASSGQNGPQIAPYRILNDTIAIGYGVNTWENYQGVMGTNNNYWYFPTIYKCVFGATPNFNSSRTDYAETGARGVLQIVCSAQQPAQNAISCKAFNDAYYIINFQNSTGGIQGQIAGINATTVAYNTTSDRRIKDEIEDMPSQLDNIKKVKARKFKWKESREDDNGFIAQEFYEVYPERNPLKNNDMYEDKLNPDGAILGMDYGRCTPYLWKGVSELIDIVRKQQEEIDLLKVDLCKSTANHQEEINLLKEEINLLKQLLKDRI